MKYFLIVEETNDIDHKYSGDSKKEALKFVKNWIEGDGR